MSHHLDSCVDVQLEKTQWPTLWPYSLKVLKLRISSTLHVNIVLLWLNEGTENLTPNGPNPVTIYRRQRRASETVIPDEHLRSIIGLIKRIKLLTLKCAHFTPFDSAVWSKSGAVEPLNQLSVHSAVTTWRPLGERLSELSLEYRI